MKDYPDFSGSAFSLLGVEFCAGVDIDQTLSDVATQIGAQGLSVAGFVQIRGVETGECECRELYLRDFATGELHSISEERGPNAKGCHLDWQSLTALAQSAEQNLSHETDVLIINRFGHSESQGRGFRGAIEKAMMLGLTVIVAVRGEYLKEWNDFHGGLAVPVPCKVDQIVGAVLATFTPARGIRAPACSGG